MRRLRTRLGLDGVEGAGSLFPLWVLVGLNAVDELDQSAFRVLSPEIREHFGLSITEITAIATLLVPVVLVLSLPIGYVADRRSRTRLAAGGAAVWATFSVATGFAPGVVALMTFRACAGLGRAVNQPTHQSLLADYYPPENRVGVFAMWRLGNPIGQFAGPLAAGVLASLFGWRVPFVVLAVPTLVLVVLASRLTEPVRGGHERRASGADDELAGIEEAAPTWDEAWRTLRGVHTLRRIWRALPFLLGGILGFGILMPLYYDEVFGIGELGRGVLAAMGEPFQVAGLVVGIPLATRMMRTRPDRALRLFAVVGTAVAGGLLVIALAPVVAVAAAASVFVSFTAAILTPGIAALLSMLIPPRTRSFAFSVNDLWALPGLGFAVVAARLGDVYGLRFGMVAMVPVFLTGAYVIASAGGQVRADIRSAQNAALAHAEYQRARRAGEAKLLVCRGVDVSYGQVQVLFGVDFDVADGEIVALLGTNGAGKSTLLKAIAGVVDPSGGSVVFDGRDITFAGAQQALRRGLVYMPGGRSVFPGLTVEQNLRAAVWTRRGDDDVAAAVESVLDRFPRLRERLHQPAGNLSGGEQQMLGLGMAFLARPTLLMIDELSLGLSPVIVAELLATVREIHGRGTTVIVVEQSVNVALELAERAVFMEKGEVRFEGLTAELLGRDDILRSVFLEGVAGAASRPTPSSPTVARRAAGDTGPVLEVRGVNHCFGGVVASDGVDLEVRRGEVVGLIGPNGAGKTTLFDIISGYIEPDEGRVLIGGRDVTGWAPHRRSSAGLGRSFQDARLFPSMTVREVLALAHDRHLAERLMLSAAIAVPDQRLEEDLLAARVEELIGVVGLEAFADKFISELSTGSRRIVDLACSLAHDPSVLLLDEPSSGIAQRETEALGPLLKAVQDLTGTTLVVIEHDMPLITSIADRIVALDLGRVIATGTPDEVVHHPDVVRSYLGADTVAVARSGRG